MQTENSIFIKCSEEKLFDIAWRVEDWPKILPHYRSVTILESSEFNRKIAMKCVRQFGIINFPCKWQALQKREPNSHKITFVHVEGVTKGMYVEWKISETEGGVNASIYHELVYKTPILGKLFSEKIIGPIFIHFVAGKTLARIKQLLESENSV